MLKSHASSLQHLIENLSDVATLKITLTSLTALLPYLLTFKKIIREIIKTVVEIWAENSQSEATRISAFLVLRRLVVIADPSIRENLLRSTYQGLIKGSRTTTVHNISGINLMKNSSVELWGLVDASVAYTSGFTFIRQLAIHLRAALKNNANDSYKTIYNWQYVHSLDFWSRVLSTHCETLREATLGAESPLRPLIYPLVQVTLGALRLIPTAAYFPLRFQLIRALIRLSRTTNTYIPLAAPLYEVLTSAEMRKPPKPSTLKPLDFDTTLRANTAYLRTRTYQDGVGEQVVELLGEFFALWCKSIAFPELALPVIVMLKRWLKEVSPYNANANSAPKPKRNGSNHGSRKSKKANRSDDGASGNRNTKLNSALQLLISKLTANSAFIEQHRSKVEFAPNDRAGVEAFLKETEWTATPLGAFVEGQRKMREQRRQVMEEARQEREAERKGRREDKVKGDGFMGSDEEDDDEPEGEEEGEMEVEDIVEDEDEEEDEDEDEMEME
jgi:nucleolar complex protein 2